MRDLSHGYYREVFSMSICEEKTCREMTARNEIEVLEIDEKLKDRILRKYDNEKAKQVEYNHYEIRRLEKLIEQKDIEIRALTGYIAFKDL